MKKIRLERELIFFLNAEKLTLSMKVIFPSLEKLTLSTKVIFPFGKIEMFLFVPLNPRNQENTEHDNDGKPTYQHP